MPSTRFDDNSVVLLVSARGVWRRLHRRHREHDKARVVIYGAGSGVSQLVTSLCQGRQYRPVAFVDDWRSMHGTQVEGLRVYAPKELPRLLERFASERILLAVPSASRSRRREILEQLNHLNVPIQTVPGIEDVLAGKAKMQDIRYVAVEDLLGRGPGEKLYEELLIGNHTSPHLPPAHHVCAGGLLGVEQAGSLSWPARAPDHGSGYRFDKGVAVPLTNRVFPQPTSKLRANAVAGGLLCWAMEGAGPSAATTQGPATSRGA